MKTRSKEAWERVSLSPAKVNLLLKVVSKRPDGYHNLVSIVDLVSLYDRMTIRAVPDGRVVVRDKAGILPTGPENTVHRAIMLLKEQYERTSGVEVLIEKHIPMGAGLGGGSSDAATVMKALVRLWDLPVAPHELMDLGGRIGADVPLFIFGASCLVRGIGERVSPLRLPPLWYVIVYPNVAISTKDVYNGLRNLLTKGEKEVRFSEDFSTPLDVANVLENDLEEVALLKCPEIKTIKERLRKAGAVGSLMSGSGSAVFGIFRDEKEAREGSATVGDLGSVFAVKSV
ncbi:MAG: 4-(cytidine 5'-diphospho)-2-C-methyl-D-erythritol kinase [Syntrophorhabdales bacterium]|jgi:4-diphosphocytidyl-2-C-methyl-D-erythritol kinase